MSSNDFTTFFSEASLWQPDYVAVSAWTTHAPFAFWLIDAMRPRTIAELGTHLGYSYFCFCQAVTRLGLQTTCTAVDTWKGDEHAGFYGDNVFQLVSTYNLSRFAGFSRLLRSTFDEALDQVPDNSIDLLHIDGRHYYEDVKHDYESWRPKLTDRGLVLFHDTRERDRDFGVYKLWAELAGSFPSFEFHHGHGLGVLAVGASQPPTMAEFFATLNEPEAQQQARTLYRRLGKTVRRPENPGAQPPREASRPGSRLLSPMSQTPPAISDPLIAATRKPGQD